MNNTQTTQENPQNTNQVPKVSTAGYWVLAIFTILFTGVIFGVLSLMNVRKINSATSIEEQDKAKNHAIMWAIIGIAVAGVFFVINMRMSKVEEVSERWKQGESAIPALSDDDNSQASDSGEEFGSLNDHTYTNEYFGLQVCFPSEYSINQNKNDAEFAAVAECDGTGITAQVVYDNSSSLEDSLEQVQREYKETFSGENYKDYEFSVDLENKKLIDQECPCIMISLSHKENPGTTFDLKQYYLKKGDFYFIYTISCPSDSTEDLLSCINPL